MISVEKLYKSFGELEILKGVSENIDKGEKVVIIGPSGSGKSTFLRCLNLLEKPTSGKIIFNGTDITDMDITERAKLGVAYAFQQPVRFKGLTVKDLLELAAGGQLGHSELCALLGKVGLCAEEYINREMNGALSGGEAKRIEIATVLARNAKLSVFDEPEAGIDLWSFSRLVETFEEIRNGTTGSLVIISHQERILSIADEIVVVADGVIRTSGRREEVLPKLLGGEFTCRCPQRKGDSCK